MAGLPRLLTFDEAALVLDPNRSIGITSRTIERYVREGALPKLRLGRRLAVRGYVDGKQREIATDTTDPRRARSAWNRFAREIGQSEKPGRRTPQTFGEVAAAYMDAMTSSRNERRYIENLKGEIGSLAIGDVRLMDIQVAANTLYSGCANETKNRQAYTPAASILHWAGENELRDYIVIRKLPEKKPETRAPKPHVRDLLLANLENRERLLLTILFFQGWRITESLGLRAEHIDLHRRELTLYVSKSRAWKTIPMHPATFEALAIAGLPEAGKVFPWRDRHAVYPWLRPLCKRLKIEFTPHMARHDFGTKIRDASDLVAVGSWTSEKSTQRYVGTPQERIKLVFAKLDTKGKRKGKATR